MLIKFLFAKVLEHFKMFEEILFRMLHLQKIFININITQLTAKLSLIK